MENRQGIVVFTFDSFVDNFEDFARVAMIQSAIVSDEDKLIAVRAMCSEFRDLGEEIQIVPEYEAEVTLGEGIRKHIVFKELKSVTPMMGRLRDLPRDWVWTFYFDLRMISSESHMAMDVLKLSLKEEDIVVVEVSERLIGQREKISIKVSEALKSMNKKNTVMTVPKGDIELKVIGSEESDA